MFSVILLGIDMSYLITKNNIGKESIVLSNNITSQTITSTVSDISGSEISYTPMVGATTVIYEFKFQVDYRPDTLGNIFLELFENTGSGYAALGNNFCIDYTANYSNFDFQPYVRFILPTYTGERSYKLRGRSSNSSFQVTLHVDTANNQTYYPTVLMTSSF